MKNHQIEKNTKAKPRTAQQHMAEIRRMVAFIEAHGSKATKRKLTLGINTMALLTCVPSSARYAFLEAAKSRRPFARAVAELTERYPWLAKYRAGLKGIFEAARRANHELTKTRG